MINRASAPSRVGASLGFGAYIVASLANWPTGQRLN
jgi:uncharacterized membrane protein YecN with MAPEG domain